MQTSTGLSFNELSKKLQITKDFLNHQKNNDADFREVYVGLNTLSEALSHPKVSVRILANELNTATEIQTNLCQSKVISEVCEITPVIISEPWQLDELLPEWNCDFIFWAISLDSSLPNQLEPLMEQMLQTSVTKHFFTIAAHNNATLPSDLQGKTEQHIIQHIQTYLNQTDPQKFECFLYDRESNNLADSKITTRPKLEVWVKSFETLVRRKPEDIVAKRLTQKWLELWLQLEHLLDQKTKATETEVKRVQEKLSLAKQNNSNLQARARMEQATQAIQQEQEQFFKQIELEVKASQAQFLNKFNRHGVIYRIQNFTDNLKARCIEKRGNLQYVQLWCDSAQGSVDINNDLMRLCYAELTRWAIAEQQRIYTYYADGGISRFFETIHNKLTFSPEIRIQSALFQIRSPLKPFQPLFQEPLAGTNCESYFKGRSLFNYIYRNLRSQWMGLSFLITFIVMFGIGDSKSKTGFIKNLLEPLQGIKNQTTLVTLLAVPICLVLFLLLSAYQDESNHKLEEEAEKLKRNLCKFYQDFTEYNVETLLRSFMEMLKLEKERLHYVLTDVREQVANHTAEAERHQMFLQKELESLKKQAEKLTTDITEFKKQIKRV